SPASAARPSSSSRATTADSQRSPSSSATFWTRYSRKRPDPTVPYHCCRQLIVRGGSYGRNKRPEGEGVKAWVTRLCISRSAGRMTSRWGGSNRRCLAGRRRRWGVAGAPPLKTAAAGGGKRGDGGARRAGGGGPTWMRGG